MGKRRHDLRKAFYSVSPKLSIVYRMIGGVKMKQNFMISSWNKKQFCPFWEIA